MPLVEGEQIVSAVGEIINLVTTDPVEKAQQEEWHEQVAKNEAAARVSARKRENGWELPLNYVPPEHPPYPLPPRKKQTEKQPARDTEDRDYADVDTGGRLQDIEASEPTDGREHSKQPGQAGREVMAWDDGYEGPEEERQSWPELPERRL